MGVVHRESCNGIGRAQSPMNSNSVIGSLSRASALDNILLIHGTQERFSIIPSSAAR